MVFMHDLFFAGISIGIERSRYAVSEDDGSIEVCALLTSGSLERRVTLTLSSQDGGASSTDPVDFSAVAVQLQFDERTLKQCAVISITNDNIVEESEDFMLMITTDDLDVTLSGDGMSTITITDTDKVAIEFEKSKYQIQEETGVEVCAALKNASLEKVLVTRLINTSKIGTKKRKD